MLTPQEYQRTLQISFEQLRLNTKVKNMIDSAMLEITEMGGDYQIGTDRIKQLNLSINWKTYQPIETITISAGIVAGIILLIAGLRQWIKKRIYEKSSNRCFRW